VVYIGLAGQSLSLDAATGAELWNVPSKTR
jgi:hypothetical protein